MMMQHDGSPSALPGTRLPRVRPSAHAQAAADTRDRNLRAYAELLDRTCAHRRSRSSPR
jgi:hypothetical protein